MGSVSSSGASQPPPPPSSSSTGSSSTQSQQQLEEQLLEERAQAAIICNTQIPKDELQQHLAQFVAENGLQGNTPPQNLGLLHISETQGVEKVQEIMANSKPGSQDLAIQIDQVNLVFTDANPSATPFPKVTPLEG